MPEKYNAIFIGVNPDPPGALYQGVYVSYVGCGPVDKLGEVGRAGFHFNVKAPPEFDVLLEPDGEVGRGIFRRSGEGKGDLYGI